MLAAKFNDKDPAKQAKNRLIVQKHLDQDGFLLMQPKVDGMRVMCHDDARSRSWKPWTNRYLQQWVKEFNDLVYGWDGELLPGLHSLENVDPEVFRRAMSEVRSEDGAGESKFTFFLFDHYEMGQQIYQKRLDNITEDVRDAIAQGQIMADGIFVGHNYQVKVIVCPTKPVFSLEEIDAAHLEFMADGWEGSILRRWSTPYKYNRGTNLDGALTKIKDFEDAEAVITGYHSAYENQNPATLSNLGYTVRSAHQANLVAKDYLGSLDVYLLERPDVQFNIGVFKGLTVGDKTRLLEVGEGLLGRIVNFTHQGYGGGYDKPRTPVFQRFRDKIDL